MRNYNIIRWEITIILLYNIYEMITIILLNVFKLYNDVVIFQLQKRSCVRQPFDVLNFFPH